MIRSVIFLPAILAAATQLCAQVAVQPNVIVSVREQKLMLLDNGNKIATFPISTSKFGIGDSRGAMTTPLGFLQVAQKIGDNVPVGAVFHNRRWTGEVLPPNAPGRDPITTRIIWLRGLQPENANAYGRCIYIHGTTEEKSLGRPASFGCIRMKSTDVAALFSQLALGAVVQITADRLPSVKAIAKDAIVSSQSILSNGAVTTNKSAADKTAGTPLQKAPAAPSKKSDATAWLRNQRA